MLKLKMAERVSFTSLDVEARAALVSKLQQLTGVNMSANELSLNNTALSFKVGDMSMMKGIKDLNSSMKAMTDYSKELLVQQKPPFLNTISPAQDAIVKYCQAATEVLQTVNSQMKLMLLMAFGTDSVLVKDHVGNQTLPSVAESYNVKDCFVSIEKTCIKSYEEQTIPVNLKKDSNCKVRRPKEVPRSTRLQSKRFSEVQEDEELHVLPHYNSAEDSYCPDSSIKRIKTFPLKALKENRTNEVSSSTNLALKRKGVHRNEQSSVQMLNVPQNRKSSEDLDSHDWVSKRRKPFLSKAFRENRTKEVSSTSDLALKRHTSSFISSYKNGVYRDKQSTVLKLNVPQKRKSAEDLVSPDSSSTRKKPFLSKELKEKGIKEVLLSTSKRNGMHGDEQSTVKKLNVPQNMKSAEELVSPVILRRSKRNRKHPGKFWLS